MKIFSKFNLKSSFKQIQVDQKDRYKTTFIVSFGQYEWKIMFCGQDSNYTSCFCCRRLVHLKLFLQVFIITDNNPNCSPDDFFY